LYSKSEWAQVTAVWHEELPVSGVADLGLAGRRALLPGRPACPPIGWHGV